MSNGILHGIQDRFTDLAIRSTCGASETIADWLPRVLFGVTSALHRDVDQKKSGTLDQEPLTAIGPTH